VLDLSRIFGRVCKTGTNRTATRVYSNLVSGTKRTVMTNILMKLAQIEP